MNTISSSDMLLLLNRGVAEANEGNKTQARSYFQQVLQTDHYNETALLWLAYLTSDPYEAVRLLETVVERNSKNELAHGYLDQARQRCKELEQLVTGSTTYNTWSRINNGNQTTPASVPLLGEYLLTQGLISQQQLEMALQRHQDLLKRGQRKMVGQVMVELGYITQAQLDRWVQNQSGEYSYRFKD